jgi:hypothetical protein
VRRGLSWWERPRASLTGAISRLAEIGPTLPPFAIIGGLAVMIRLGRTHRATNDIDTVSDDQLGLIDVLVADGFGRHGDSVMIETDLKLDVIDVSEGDPDYIPFLTHRFAFDTRAEVGVVVQPSGGGPPAAARVQVASPSALVAIKLGISEGVGRQRDSRKIGSDAFDVVRLLQRFGPDAIGADLTLLGQPKFVAEIRRLAERHLVEESDRTAASMVRSAIQGVVAIGADQVELLGRALVGQLAPLP